MGFVDTLTDTAGTNLESHTPDTGTGWSLTGTTGSFRIASSGGDIEAPITANGYYICDDQGSANHESIMKHSGFSASGVVWMAVRLVDNNNFIGYRLYGTGSLGRRLSKVVAGTITDLVSSQGVSGEWIKVKCDGTTVTFWGGGTGGTPSWVQIGTDQTVADHQTETSQGVLNYNTTSLISFATYFAANALGGGGFQAAWAVNSNQIIQVGGMMT